MIQLQTSVLSMILAICQRHTSTKLSASYIYVYWHTDFYIVLATPLRASTQTQLRRSTSVSFVFLIFLIKFKVLVSLTFHWLEEGLPDFL